MDWVRLSADIALLAFLLSWLLRSYGRGPVGMRFERRLYALGGGLMVGHVLIAYGSFHGWSHAAALSHTAAQTKQVVGWSFAAGLYFNFLFVAVYLVDIVWRQVRGGWERRQPRRIAQLVDIGLWFVVAMSTIVFESGVVRAVATAGLLAVLIGNLRSRKPIYRGDSSGAES